MKRPFYSSLALALALLASAPALATSATASEAHPLQFSAAAHFAAGNGPWLLSAGDVLGNGRQDLAVANIFGLGSNGASLLMNTTAGTGAPAFAPPIGFNAYGAQAPLLVDLTGSGRPDLVVCDEPGLPHGRCSAYPNTTPPGATSPTFGPAAVLATGNTPEIVRAADMNGDGKPDIVTANFGSLGPGATSVFVNTSTPGHLSFAAAQNFNGGIGAEGMAIADLNGDGKPDIVTGNTAGNDITAIVNLTPSGSSQIQLAPPQHFPGVAGPTAVVATDLNGDGRPDLAVGNSFTFNSNALTVMINQTPPGATTLQFTNQTFTADPGIEGIDAADFAGDGKPDLAYAAYRSSSWPVTAICGGGGALPAGCGALGDNGTAGVVGVMRNTTPKGATVATFEPRIKLASGNATVAVIAADFNGDGRPDLAAGNFIASGDGGISIFTNETTFPRQTAQASRVATAGVGGTATLPNTSRGSGALAVAAAAAPLVLMVFAFGWAAARGRARHAP